MRCTFENDTTPIFDNEFIGLNYVEETLESVSVVEIAKETKRDGVLNKIIRYVSNEWPSVKKLEDSEQKYYAKRDELSVEKGCLMWGYRIVIPEVLRERVLRELHTSHFGVVKIKMIARSYV